MHSFQLTSFPLWIRYCQILIILSLACHSISAQTSDKMLRDTSSISAEQYQQLIMEFGSHKKLPLGYEKIAVYTLSFFPELKKHRIHFKVKQKGAPASSRPAWGSFFRSAGKRTYMVFINGGQDSSRFGSIFSRASIPAQVGVIGHELSHVVHFSQKTSLGLMGIGVAHISKPYMDRFEFNTDSLCIAHGLGYYQMEWAAIFDKMFSGNGTQDPFKNKNTPTGERYMSAATIQSYMRKMGY